MVEAINDSLVVLDSRIEVLDPLTLVVHTPGWWLVVSEILSVETLPCPPSLLVPPYRDRYMSQESGARIDKNGNSVMRIRPGIPSGNTREFMLAGFIFG